MTLEVDNFATGRLWLVGLVGKKIAAAISKSFHIVKIKKLIDLAISRCWLVGLVGQKLAKAIPNHSV